jgi:peptidoglycan/xylan/chitin deacetylase (PgdA/CDA1 family)
MKISGIKSTTDKNEYLNGGINRFNRDKKQIALIFIGHEYSDGYHKIIKILEKNGIKATFFLTSDFIRKSGNLNKVKGLIKKGHDIGPATSHYKLLADWNRPDLPKVKKQTFLQDLRDNYLALKQAGVSKSHAPFFFPPFELYNDSISQWCKDLGIYIVRSTPGTLANQDYTFPEMRENYFSSREIYENILENEASHGLNGYILQFNLGSNSARKDKIYNNLASIIVTLKRKGYTFTNLFEATGLISRPVLNEKK